MKLLHIDSSIAGDGSVTRTLSADIVKGLAASHSGLEVTYRDVATDSFSHLTWSYMAALQGAPADEATGRELQAGLAALEEFLAADIILIGAPMYNFGVPSQLKAWIDRLAVPGKTFSYNPQGPVGLCAGKKLIVASARGGVFSAGPAAGFDHQESYLTTLFGFLGIKDITFVRAEGVAMGPEARTKAIEAAREMAAKVAA
ncbi:MAG: FMN-dependent NADH-azoreductase [Bradyrhizobiaceae bacterium]|nr:MAG: FMN-dependent NADH-azoreductase [Bradyrhizobiaceae bacterium]